MKIEREVVISGQREDSAEWIGYIAVLLNDLTPVEKAYFEIGDKVKVTIEKEGK